MTATAAGPRPAEDLVVETRWEGATAAVVVRGEVDVATAPLLRVVLEGICAGRPSRVEIDMSGVAYLDSHALRMLVAARRRLAAARSVLALRDPSPPARGVLALAGLDRAFEYAEPAPAGGGDSAGSAGGGDSAGSAGGGDSAGSAGGADSAGSAGGGDSGGGDSTGGDGEAGRVPER